MQARRGSIDDRRIMVASCLRSSISVIISQWLIYLQDWSFGHTDRPVDDDMFLEFVFNILLSIYLRFLIMMMMKTKKRRKIKV